MFKRFLLAALASVALFAACDKNKEEEEIIPVSFSSFGFYAKDNAGVLKTDYIAENISTGVISFTLPYGTDPAALKTLVPGFAVTEGASVNVADASGAPDGKNIVSGVTPVDFSAEVQLVVFLKNNFKAYTVSVKIAEPAKWGKVAESSLVMDSNPAFAINPKDGAPYVAGSSVNADKVAVPHLLKLDGAELKDVAGALAEVGSEHFAIDICSDGTPYVSFLDKVVKKQCVMKVSGSKAELVGEANAMYKTGGGSNSSVGLFAFSTSDIWCAQYNDERKVLVERRALNLAHFDGSAWTNAISIPGRNAKADGSTDAILNLRAFDFDIASNGDIYVMAGGDYSVEKLFNLAVVKIAAKDKAQTLIGGEMTIDIDKSRSASMSLDSNDVPYVVYTKPEGNDKYAYFTFIDAKTKTWSNEEKLSSNPSDFVVLRFDDKGLGYIVSKETIDKATKYVLYSSGE